jgi:acyl-CoA thioesterase-1
VGRAYAAGTAAAHPEQTIVCFGDSLTAGYGLPAAQSYPGVLQKVFDQQGLRYKVVNLGQSGDTTEDGIRRLPSALAQKPDVVVLEFGANDALRGMSFARARQNLAQMIERFHAAGAEVILGGMQFPPSYAPDYVPAFNAIYPSLASSYGVPLIPFFLEGVAGHPELTLPDGMHPNAAGARRVAELVYQNLRPVIAR